jgi:Cu/Ag efflux pump CusA
VLVSLALMAAGLYVTTTMPVDVFPDFTAPTVTILTEAHGMAPQASAMGEVLFLAIRSDQHSLFDLRTLADTTIRRRLLAVEGVAQVTPIGGDVKQYQVVLSPSKLQAYNISASEVAEALKQTNQNATAGIMVAIQRHGLRVGQVGHEIERAFAGRCLASPRGTASCWCLISGICSSMKGSQISERRCAAVRWSGWPQC